MFKNKFKVKVKGNGDSKSYQKDKRDILKFVPKLRKVKRGGR